MDNIRQDTMSSGLEERIMTERKRIKGEAEPIKTVERSVCQDGRSGLKHNIPMLARDLCGIEDGDDVEIQIYQDGYVVRKK